MKRRLIRVVLGAVLLILILAGGSFWYISQSGSGKLEQWIGSQLQTIANSYINPKLSFTDLDYAYPFSVSLKNFKLTAEDPAHPGHTIDVIACDSASISLAEIPSVGKPIVIEKIALDKPLISAVATATGSKDFVGFSNLIRADAMSTKPAEKPQEKPAGAPTKLSDVFRMRLVQLIDGKVIYDPRIPGTVPMTLDQINTTLAIEPTSTGWYKLNVAIARKPVFDLAIGGQLDLDTFTVHDADIKLLADLSGERLDYLPPELQQILKQYEAKGKLSIAVTGTMPAMDPMKGQVQADVKLTSAHAAMGDFHVPIEDVSLSAKFADGKVDLSSLKVVALGGSADLSGSATLNDRLDADLSLKVTGMVLENLLRQGPGPNPAKLDLDFKVVGSLMAILGKVPAAADKPLGAISLRDFRLSANDPVSSGQKVDIVAVKNLDIALAEPVVSGKPIVIEKIILDHPVLSVVAVAPNSLQVVGMPNLPPSLTAPTTAPSTPAPPPEPVTFAPQKISDLIRVKTFQLVSAKVIYDPRIPNTDRMWLDNINTSINLDPADPGVYTLAVNLGRKPVFDLSVGSKINVDRLGVEDLKVNLLADLTQGQTDFLLPQVQAILKESKASGILKFSANGSVPFNDLVKAKLHAESTLDQVKIVDGDQRVPLEGFKFVADIADGKVTIPTMSFVAAGSTFNLSGSALLNDRLDTDLTLHLDAVPIEKVLSAFKPGSAYNTLTLLDADVQVRASVTAALSGVPAKPGEPVVSLAVKNFHLTTDDAGDNPLQFVSCDGLTVSLSSLPVAGNPVVVDSVVVTRPSVRAVAMGAGSSEFVGFANLQKIAAGRSPTTKPANVPATERSQPAAPTVKLSSLFRLNSLTVTDASLYYDPQVQATVPMTVKNVGAKLGVDSAAGNMYAFGATIPSQPDLEMNLAGKMNIDALTIDGLKMTFSTDLSKSDAGHLPPEIQTLLKQYDVAGMLNVEVSGQLPIADPTAAEMLATVKLDNVKATAADYRIPVDHVRLPVRLKNKQVDILPATGNAGGPMVEALSGTIDLTGSMLLNPTLTAPKLDLIVKDVQLQKLSDVKIHKDPKQQDLVGLANADIHLVNAPLLTIADAATPPDPKAPPKPAPVLPEDWGYGSIRITEARLAGLELVQFMGNAAKSVFVEPFKRVKDEPAAIKPKERANIDFRLMKDQVVFEKSKIFYEGEVVAVEGEGTMTLSQKLDFRLRGGPWAKLGGVGLVGDWLKNASNSLISYTVTGSPTDAKYPTFSATTGDGKPILEGVSTLADKGKEGIGKGVDATKKGLDKAGGFLGNIFKKKDE